jgi:hypothetical protein
VQRRKLRLPDSPGIDWHIAGSIEPSKIDGHPIRIINFSFRAGDKPAFEFSVPAEDAFDMREDIGKAYDQVS